MKNFKFRLSQINEIINQSNLSEIHKSRAIKIVELILRNNSKNCASLDEYVGIPASYWKKVITTHYEIPMRFLLANKVIFRSSYSRERNQCYGYRVNRSMLMTKRPDDSV